jgi:hypothetical protein
MNTAPIGLLGGTRHAADAASKPTEPQSDHWKETNAHLRRIADALEDLLDIALRAEKK